MNNKYKIMLVEDEKNIHAFVSALLEAAGYTVISALNCSEGKLMFSSHNPDLIILDLGLPDEDGTSLLTYIRKCSYIPIIVLSARTDESDKVDALDKGANDYITKPFGSAELVARVRSALRTRNYSGESRDFTNSIFTLGDMEINYDARRITISGTEINLTQTEYNIIALLSRYSGKVMTYSAIIKAIWGYNDEGSRKKLQVNMANIRKKLGVVPGKQSYIINKLGVGYQMNTYPD